MVKCAVCMWVHICAVHAYMWYICVYGQSICGMFMCGMCSICMYILWVVCVVFVRVKCVCGVCVCMFVCLEMCMCSMHILIFICGCAYVRVHIDEKAKDSSTILHLNF